jgi:guanyl-specific ribonuclease Sa
MYNLTVADAHTFFVGDGQWLVHNTCDIPDLHRPSILQPELEKLDDVVVHLRREGRPRPAGHQGKWGETYENIEGYLPSDTTYREYYVPGDPNNRRRAIVGDNGKIYYSNTHYGQNPHGSTPFYYYGGGAK